ncbi:MAG: hypothetical protein A2023_07210 [Sulfuricurvum sp. GWF2_44_89]|uniref:GNAT family N-acetyltransferase n=1 Tax=Sulfuricurvum kujiense TaxID=148813 RepID=A0A2D3WQ75_9BACT|nr:MULTISPECIES: hypothetical protein [Sulfuricurvum]OHD78266.1 MAG: hypothetical protein A2023_07210 [Sulfuricurvum sp. GWF2_44_89]OHD91573.1 MAG: hypothetical protein A2517_07150 [Sulfuricurvum sp. RIFOXYD12_FULL_44_77]OHD94139.1 MAG: hypothetical protein A2552_01715 [Sulfuricurvum sp. RIFOXYD2_FULL_44_160]DAB38853.1 MAG TPA: GNAT family N-acetyltransferase [Sulfuricurvum kujiense]
MEKESIPYFCEDLNSYLKTMFKYKKNYSHAIDATICAYSKKFDIYLRWNGVYYSTKFPKNLTIARIGFYKERKGYGKALLCFLIECSSKYQFDYIVIEATNEKSASFAHKFGFQKIDDEDGRNFVIAINDLRIIMSSM